MLNRTELLNYEIDYSIETILNLKSKEKPSNLFSTNIIRGFTPATNTILDEYLDKELWLDIVSSNNDSDRLKALHPIIDEAKRISNSVNKNRKILEKETSNINLKSLMYLLFLDTQEKVISRFSNFNLEKEFIQKIWKENPMSIYKNIPSLNIEIQLKYHAFKNKLKSTVENDIFDWGALSSAINYYDIVITEKYWTNIAIQAKLNVKYNTIIKNDLKNVIDIIV